MSDFALFARPAAPLTTYIRIAILPVALVAALILATILSSTDIPPLETLHILLARIGLYSGPKTWSAIDQAIIWQIRVPRVLAAALVGMALSVAGALFQAVLRNPLADPYVIGTSAGAQLGVIIALLLPVQLAFAGFGTLQAFAFAGALITVLVVYSIARTSGRTPVVTLLLAGFVISSFLISASTFLMLITNREQEAMSWTMGSVDVSELSQLTVIGPAIVLLAAATLLLAPRLDVILLGEEHAEHLGVPVEILKLAVIVLASLLTALAVTLAGIVAFVGLVVPHAVRLIYGPSHRVLLPASALAGAIFVVIADLLSRVLLAPTPIPLGIVTSVAGAPLFLHLLRRTRRQYAL